METIVKEINWQDVFAPFLSKDDYRPAMGEVRLVDKYVYATDAHILIRVNSDLVPSDFYKVESEYKYVDVKSAVDRHSVPDHEFELSVSSVIDIYDKMPRVKVYDDCDQCDGYGEIECDHCHHCEKCEECNGTGNGVNVVGEKIDRFGHVFQMANSQYDPNNLIKAFKAFQLIGEETIQVGIDEKKKSAILHTDDVLILVMGLASANVEDSKVYKLH